MAELVAGQKKGGLTFAPEAGTQRLRDVINKNVTEDDLFAAIDAAFAAGWRRCKLYFMVGLPTDCLLYTSRRCGPLRRHRRRGGRMMELSRETVAGVIGAVIAVLLQITVAPAITLFEACLLYTSPLTRCSPPMWTKTPSRPCSIRWCPIPT